MRCPNCGNPKTKVNETEGRNIGSSVRRHRECTNCNTKFVTVETVRIPIKERKQ